MQRCNDPKCPLNRQGVPHEPHELIESKKIINPCKDGRCAMNRMGIPHNAHDMDSSFHDKNFKTDSQINKLSKEQIEAERKRRQQLRREHEESEKEQLRKDQEEEIERLRRVEEKYLLKKEKNAREDSQINKLSREQVEAERQRRKRLDTEQNRNPSQTITEKPTSTKPKSSSGFFSRFSSKTNIPSANQILQSHDPYMIFGLKPDTTCQEIKLKFKDLSRTYNASRGSINKSKEEKAQINAIQSRINTAYDTLRKRHCG